jgi:hypothetical protein
MKNKDDKTNFLSTDEDYSIFNQLPDRTKADIFTDFLFRDFLWKFRRLFYFRKADCVAEVNGIRFSRLLKVIKDDNIKKKTEDSSNEYIDAND